MVLDNPHPTTPRPTSGIADRVDQPVRSGPPQLGRWIVLCLLAEAIGMTAAATAAQLSQHVVGDPDRSAETWLALGLVVAGGLVEGTALGLAQSVGLSGWLSSRRRRQWVLVTVTVAGLGWAAASTPAVLSGSGGPDPGIALVLGGAAALGALMGAVLGVAQAPLLRGVVPHPWRWVLGNVVAWSLTMPVIFAGATAPGPTWPVIVVIPLGAVTGAAAGTVLGLATGIVLPSLAGPRVSDRFVLALLTSPIHRVLDRAVLGVRLRGRVSGRLVTLPVMYAADRHGLVVVPGAAGRKRWWRNLREPAAVEICWSGRWRPANGWVLEPSDRAYGQAAATYRQRWPRSGAVDGPLVRITLDTPPAGPAGGREERP